MLEWNGIIKYFVFHHSILMFSFLCIFSFYYAQLFKKQICIKICISVFTVKIQWLWCQFTLCLRSQAHSFPGKRLLWSPPPHPHPHPPSLMGLLQALYVFLWHLLLMTVLFFFSGPHSVLCWLGSPPGPLVIFSHCQFFLCLSSKQWVSAAPISFAIFCHLMYSL